MDPQEIRDKILAAINNVIQDNPDEAQSNLHDVLAAKMRDRINPTSATSEPTDEEDVDLDSTDDEIIEDDPVDEATGED